MKEYKVAAAIIQELETYHFQFRDGKKQNGALGKVGLFGGKIDEDESPREAVYREVALEEANIQPPPRPEDFRVIDSFTCEGTERWLKIFKRNVKTDVTVFQLLLPHHKNTRVAAKEGTLITLRGGKEVLTSLDVMTPVAEKAMRRHFNAIEHN